MTKEEELITELVSIVEELGWKIVIPKTEDDEMCDGMIIGSDAFLKEINIDLSDHLGDGEPDGTLH